MEDGTLFRGAGGSAVPPAEAGEEGSTGAGITATCTLATLEAAWGQDPRWKVGLAKASLFLFFIFLIPPPLFLGGGGGSTCL